MTCKKCGKDLKIHARGLCRKCYDAEPDIKEKRRQWKEENVYSRLKERDMLRLLMR